MHKNRSFSRSTFIAPHGQSLDDFPNLKRWSEAIARRPAAIRAYVGTKDSYSVAAGTTSDEERRILFGTSKTKTAS
jgi:GST-like protein